MNITIKNIPTQEIADRIIGVAKNLIDTYTEEQARVLSRAETEAIDIQKDAWREENGLEKEFTKVKEEVKEEVIVDEMVK